VGLVDVAPTIRDAFRIEPKAAEDGVSLWPSLARGTAADPDRGFYAETLDPRQEYGWSELHAWRRRELKYVRAPRPELYDVAADPREGANLVTTRAEDAARLAALLQSWMTRPRASSTSSPEGASLSDAEREQLETLGYAGTIAAPDGATGLLDPKDGLAEVAR